MYTVTKKSYSTHNIFRITVWEISKNDEIIHTVKRFSTNPPHMLQHSGNLPERLAERLIKE